MFYFLQSVDFYDIVIEQIYDVLNSPWEIGSITIRLSSFLSFFIILFVTFSATRLISNVIDGGALDFMNLSKGVPHIISVVTRYFLIGLGFILAISAIGINLSQFNLMAGALGLGIGFGLQNIISNFISGLILIFERPIQTNDVVEMGTIIGTVKKIGIRSSNIHTFDGAEVIVPNSNLISNEVTNWTLSDAVKRVEIRVGTAYGTDLPKVVDLLKNVAEDYPEALKNPEPLAFFDAFGDSSLDFRLLVWVPVEIAFRAKSEIAIEVYKRFKEEKIEIPFPQRDLHIKSDDRSVGKKD
jgi:small-conductance mechanosensitive channel